MKLPSIDCVEELGKSDCLVVGVFQSEGADGKDPALVYSGIKNRDLDDLLSRVRDSKHFSGRKAEINLLRFFSLGKFPSTALMGLGTQRKWSSEMARQAGASLYAFQRRERLSKLALRWADIDSDHKASSATENLLQAFCEGYFLGSYEFKAYKKEDKKAFYPEGLEIQLPKAGSQKGKVERARLLTEAVFHARELGDIPPNDMTPALLARRVEAKAKKTKLKCTILNRTQIEKEKMGLLIGVGKGSHEEPKLVILEHRKGKKSDKPLVLIGKGVTFDSGGISIKPAAGMEEMKWDMMGAATVAGIMQAVASLDLPLNIVGIIAAAENMPSGTAQKPGDIQRSLSGKTVEITNTDAEGRLILADAIEYAQKYYSPQIILDFATLTGAVLVALGTVAAGIMGNSPSLIGQIKKASERTGERVWELPLFEEYEEDLKSTFADIKNAGSRDAGSSKGGTFIKFFVDSKIPWVHFDIAGVAMPRKDVSYNPTKNASGAMVRLAANLLEHWQPLK